MESGAAVGTSGGVRAEARARARVGLRWSDRMLLVAIGVVVVIVSLPRLRAFALR